MRWDSLINDGRFRCQSRRQIQELRNADLQFGPLSYEGVMTEAYGQRLGEAMRAKNSPAIVTRALRTADMAVTEIRCDNPLPQMNGPIRQEDCFFVALYLRDSPNRESWEDGRRVSVGDHRIGESSLHDLKRAPAVLIHKPYHFLAF